MTNEWDRGWRDGFNGRAFDRKLSKPHVYTYALGYAWGERDREKSTRVQRVA